MERISYLCKKCEHQGVQSICRRCDAASRFIEKTFDFDRAVTAMGNFAKFIDSTSYVSPNITKVIFNDPATIVLWSDGTKTVVKATDEPFDPEKGLAMAISKKMLGNKGNYYNTFKEWLPEK